MFLWNAHTGELMGRLEGHRSYVNSLRFSPDGRLLASASEDQTVGLWTLAALRRTFELPHGASVDAITFSADGQQLASTGDGIIRIRDPATGRLIRSWKANSENFVAAAVAFSPDASLLASVSGETVKVWDAATGALRSVFTCPHRVWEAVAFHPGGQRLYTSGFGIIKEYELDRRELLDDATAAIDAAAVSPDGRYVASASRDRIVRIYDAASGQLTRSLSGHSGAVRTLAFSPDSVLLATGSSDKTIKLWNVADGRLVRTWSGHRDEVSSLAFYPDGGQIALRLCRPDHPNLGYRRRRTAGHDLNHISYMLGRR